MERVSNQSEIARLLAQIEAEYIAATRGLFGLAATATHEAITAAWKIEENSMNILRAVVGDDATRLMSERTPQKGKVLYPWLLVNREPSQHMV